MTGDHTNHPPAVFCEPACGKCKVLVCSVCLCFCVCVLVCQCALPKVTVPDALIDYYSVSCAKCRKVFKVCALCSLRYTITVQWQSITLLFRPYPPPAVFCAKFVQFAKKCGEVREQPTVFCFVFANFCLLDLGQCGVWVLQCAQCSAVCSGVHWQWFINNLNLIYFGQTETKIDFMCLQL